MNRPPEANRRTYLKGLSTVTALAGGIPIAAGAAGGEMESTAGGGQQDDQRNGPPDDVEEMPVAHASVADLDGGSFSGNSAFDVDNRYPGDPGEEGDREWVLHYTTDGEATRDFPAAMFNLRARRESTLRLEDISLDEGAFTYDFYVGPEHESATPGQVILVIQEPEQQDDEQAWGIFKTVDLDGPREQWRTLDILSEMGSDGTDEPWRELEIDTDPQQFQESFESVADGALQQAFELYSEEANTFADVYERFADDSRLVAAGIGSGALTPTVRDIYFDDVRLDPEDDNGGDDGDTFELPAVLEMDTAFDRNNRVVATLTFPEEQEGVDIQDFIPDSLRAHGLSQIAPPVGEGARPSRVEVSDDELAVYFPPGRLRQLDRVGGGEHRLVVSGEFDYEHVVWFFGTGQARIPGN